MRVRSFLVILGFPISVFLVACGGGDSNAGAPVASGNIAISVTGLTANSPSITLSEEDSATAQTFTTTGTGSDTFVLSTPLTSGAPYSVATSVSPLGMTCSESANGTATLPESNNIQIACIAPPAAGGGGAPTAPVTLTTVFQNGLTPQGFQFTRAFTNGNATSGGTAKMGLRLPPNGIWPLGSFPSGATYSITMTPPSGSGYTCVLASTSRPSSGTFNSTPDPVNVIFNCGNPGTP